MSLAARQVAVARLLTDPDYRVRLFDPDTRPEELDLDAADLALLRRLDPRRLDVVSEGYVGKRLERVLSFFPRSFAVLVALDPAARGDYLAQTPFAPDDAAERATFLAWAARRADEATDAGRLLLDLLDAESALLAAPPPAPVRSALPLDASPRLRVRLLPVRGPLADALASPTTLPASYPARPGWIAALRRAEGPLVAPVDAGTKALLEACDGRAPLAALEARFGPAARPVLDAWLRAGALDP